MILGVFKLTTQQIPSRGIVGKALRFGPKLITNPREAKIRLAQKLGYEPWHEITPHTLNETPVKSGLPLVHIGAFTNTNGGDTLLCPVLRDLFGTSLGDIQWRGLHVHTMLTSNWVQRINRSRGVVVGGGGLFLRDTFPNPRSGWQWNCSIENLEQIKVPLSIFAVGYNRFRNQPDFDPIFREHLLATVEKAAFFGLRNSGSIRAIRGMLPEHLHDKVRFQPCMTTIMNRVYPKLFEIPEENPPFIALNCAFDRSKLRYGDQMPQILSDLADAMLKVSKHIPIKYYAHSPDDYFFLPYLDIRGIPYERVQLFGVGPREVLEAYGKPAISIGMRGHAQMIPFGWGRPIISLISHDKLGWFLEDINARDWGVDVSNPGFTDHLTDLTFSILNNIEAVKARVLHAQDQLWKVTDENLGIIRRAVVH